MAWAVGVEVPDDLAGQDLRVFQGEGNSLEEDQVHELRWPLIDPLGSVVVRWTDEVGTEGKRSLESGKYRLFKISKSGVAGRAVARVTRGHYVVIAPRTLTRAETSKGIAPVAPENVNPEESGLLAHHMLVEAETDALVLGRSGITTVEVRPSTTAAYKLFGREIEDAHDGAGPLFGREPPHLRVEGAEQPTQVVVGVEGPSLRRRPRQVAGSFEDVRSWFDEHQPGWFFVRLYDGNDDILDSLDFRYARGLEAIEMDEHSPLPRPCGHLPARVHFHIAAGVALLPVDGPAEIISAQSICLPARPDAGQARLRLQAEKGGGVDVVVRIPRVWWAFTGEEKGDQSPRWMDMPRRLAMEHFRPTSSMLLRVLLPAPGWAEEIVVGLRGGIPRRVRIPRSERTVHFPLRNLGEEDALLADGRHDLVMWLRTGTGEHGPVTVGEFEPTEHPSQEHVGRQSLDLSVLSAPRLMSVITHLGGFGSAQDRRVIRCLRVLYYRRVRRNGPAETHEFLCQGLALVAALLDRASTTLRLSLRWRRRARLAAAQEPIAVSVWKRRLRQDEPSGGGRAGGLAGTGGSSA